MTAPALSTSNGTLSSSSSSTKSKVALRTAGKEYARKTIANTFEKSAILDNSSNFPKFSVDEVKLGKILGKGGFGTVFEVRGFFIGGDNDTTKGDKRKPTKNKWGSSRSLNLDGDADSQVNPDEMESRQFIAEHCIRHGGDARYAAKFLSKEVIEDPPTFIQGIMDMATETRVLSDIEHPNIIKMRAFGDVSPFEEKYFIVMDRLYDTMESRIAKWDKRIKRNTGFGALLLDRKGNKKKDILEEKLVAAFDLSAAIGYLHQRNIVYRDLKPENIGFDIRDDVKVFDFGLAKELRADMPHEDGLYRLTGMTGSPRYMAPEVALEKPYNHLCDSYSFAILFWQMYSCKTPFELYTMKSLKAKVWEGEHKRPFVPDDWPVPIKTLLKRAWSKDIKERPNFQQIYKILRTECVRVREGNDDGLEHQRRRSTFVFRGARGQLQSTTKAIPLQS